MTSDFEKFANIIKPVEDKREYLGLKLRNQLKVLLVSDAETDISAASLSVHVGSLADPWELQGLAHFLEHMLFMGTKKVFFKSIFIELYSYEFIFCILQN